MKLYHGTSERHLAAILKDGIKPRGKRRGNWKHTIDSNNKAVYLTNAYAHYFAWQAVNTEDKAERLVVLEIDTDKLDPSLLAPDEDWLEQVSRRQNDPGVAPIDKSMNYRTRWYRKRLLNFGPHWTDSLEGLGNATYHDVIPVAAITRIAFVDQETNADLIMVVGLDPSITLMNYRIVGHKYRNGMKRLFGEAVEEDDSFDRLRPVEEVAMRKVVVDGIYAKIEVRELA